MNRRDLTRATLLALALVTPAAAQGGGRGWFDLAPDEQQRAWQNYQRYQRIPERQRGRIEQRYQAFQALPPEERQRLRQNYDQLRTLDPDQRRQFGKQYRRWKDEGGRPR